MQNNILFKGIMPALITPLNDDSTVRVETVAPLMNWMIGQGVEGFYVLGATGEGAALAECERMRMAEAAADVAKNAGKKMILHVGAADTQSAKRLAKHAAEVGADAISSVYPSFFCHYTADEALDYYRALVDAAGIPMMGYCTPMIRGVDVVTFVERLMKIEGVIGVKYTFPNYYDMFCIKHINGGNINVINGPDETLLAGLSMGADGGIGSTYNLMADRYVKLYQAVQSNDLKTAFALQEGINRVIAVMLRHGVIPSIKLGLEAKGFACGHAAFPGHRYSKEERELILSEFHAAGLEL